MSRERTILKEIEAVYRGRGADFFRFALARTGDPERARDAVQEGFARAIRARHSFRGLGSIEAWIGRCVLNAAVDASHTDGVQLDDETEVSFAMPETDEGVRSALRGLPQRQRDALFLRFYLDFDYVTIAETLGIEVGTVSATLHAARENLTHALQEVT